MVILCCPQCQARLPVSEAKLGKTLFVCPSCAFPLDASNQVVEGLEATTSFVASDYIARTVPVATSPPPRVAAIAPPTPPPPTKQGKAARSDGRKAAPDSSFQKSAVQRFWLLGAACLVGPFLLVGLLFLTLGKQTPPAEVGKPKLDLLEVLALSAALQDPDVETRKRAVLALSDSGSEAKPALPALLEALKWDDDEKFRDLVLDALDQAGPPAKGDFPILSLALRDEDPDVRAYAVSIIASLGQEAWGEIAQVRAMKEDADPYVRAAAETALAQLEKDMLEFYTRQLKDPSPDARRDAANGLAELGLAARAATSSLMTALEDENDAVRVAAREALVQLGAHVVPELTEAIGNRNVRVRRTAIAALGSMGPDAVDALPKLVDLVDDNDPEVGKDAAEAVAQFKEFAVPALSAAIVRVRNPARVQVLGDLIVRIGPAAAGALEVVVNRVTVEKRRYFQDLFVRVGPNPLLAPILPLPPGQGGTIYKDLLGQFHAWDRNKDGHLDRNELRQAFGGNDALAKRFLHRLDHRGEGRISHRDYERWAHEHTMHLVREREARHKLEAAHHDLEKKVATARKHDQAEASKSLHQIKAEPKAAQKTQERQAAVAGLRTARRKEHSQQAQAQAEMLRQQRELARMSQKHAAVAKHVTPARYQPPKPKPSVRKPPTRTVQRPPVQRPPVHRPAPPRPVAHGRHH